MWFPGVEDQMALALELSRREGKTNPPPPQKPSIHSRSAAEPDRHQPTTQPGSTHRSFSSAPFFNYTTASEEDEDDEDLQMALACSLSEMEAKQRAAATDLIAGALGGGGAKRCKAAVHKKIRVVEITTENVGGNERVVSQETNDEKRYRVTIGPGGKIEKEEKKEEVGNASGEPGSSSESPTTSSKTQLSSEQEFECVAQNSEGRAKKKKKCGCSVC